MKITRHDTDGRGADAPRPSAREMANRAAIEKSMATYVHLNCDHYTTRESIEAYAAWQAEPGRYYCETCGKYRETFKEAKPASADSTIPLFLGDICGTQGVGEPFTRGSQQV